MSSTEPTDAKQLAKFKEAARELDCDENEKHWDDNLRKVATQKPKDEPHD